MPGSLAPGDLPLILEHQLGPDSTMDETAAWFLDNFQASDGAKAVTVVNGVPALFQIPTIVPRLTEQGCVFLKEGKCSIHPVAPFACAHLDPHMSEEDADQRARALVMSQLQAWQQDGSYAEAWRYLHENGRRATPLAERKAAVEAAFTALERKTDG